MKARQQIEGATFDPAQLKAIGQAFDDVWEQIAPEVSARAGAVEAARYRLAHLVLSVAKKGILERDKIKDEVLQLVQASPTKQGSTRTALS